MTTQRTATTQSRFDFPGNVDGQAEQLKRKFSQVYLEYGTVGATLKAIGLNSRRIFNDWLRTDADFKALYENELQVNRRDVIASLVYRAGLGLVSLEKNQLNAAFGFLRAIEAGRSSPPDDLAFTENTQSHMDFTSGGKPIESIVRVVDA